MVGDECVWLAVGEKSLALFVVANSLDQRIRDGIVFVGRCVGKGEDQKAAMGGQGQHRAEDVRLRRGVAGGDNSERVLDRVFEDGTVRDQGQERLLHIGRRGEELVQQ